ncbi:Uncharacterised protein [[Clostridium] sordellii]|uniref:hypothetical protein n=1 Tax=Paraclostridium sordellii TaxID=1505 RepID=UPI0005DC2098|nr:hypothetical protein [Paeniclostridium sordellii]CEN30854.1 Uncharacterised protein [[Clostridium] sordellii] [Paeniclostridium sordellii]
MDELVIFNNIIIKNFSEIKQNKSNYKFINTYMKNLYFYIKRLGGGMRWQHLVHFWLN